MGVSLRLRGIFCLSGSKEGSRLKYSVGFYIRFLSIQGEEQNIEYMEQKEGLILLNLRFASPGTHIIQVTDKENKNHNFKIIKL